MLWSWLWLPLMVVLTSNALPVPDDDVVDTSTKLIGSSVVTSVSVVMGEGEKETDLPASTVDMLKPDGFQFYTVDDKGKLITRQMTDAEIQSIIAAGGGPFPIETQDPQKTGDNITADMKVADVVQNVQNVLKEELNKPATVIGTVPTIPGHANEEWSSILPAILGGDTESAPVSLSESETDEEIKSQVSSTTEKIYEKLPELVSGVDKTEVKEKEEEEIKSPVEENKKNTTDDKKAAEVKPTEIPMVQVSVITAESVHPTTTETKPVYEILNTISADEVKEKNDDDTVTTTEITKTSSPEIESEKVETVKTTESSSTVETIVEIDVGSSFVPVVSQNKTDKEKFETPSITLEAPAVVEEVETAISVPVKSEEENKEEEKIVADLGTLTTENIKTEKPEEVVVAADDEKLSSKTIETTTLAIKTEEEEEKEEVSQVVNLIPESISAIVDELVSDDESTKVTEKIEVDDSEIKINEKDVETNIVSVSNATKVSENVDKVENHTESNVEQNLATVTENSGDLNASTSNAGDEKKTETLLTDSELADSVSSMISQVSEVLPSMVPIPQKSEDTDLPVKRIEDEEVKEEAAAAKPSATEIQPPTKQETKIPEKTDSELVKIEVKVPEVTTIESVISTSTNDSKTESPVFEDKKTEEVSVTPADSETTIIPDPSNSDKESVKAGEETTEKVDELVADSEAEASIVRIDISEAKPTDSDLKNSDSTESSVVRIKLTNPAVETINEMIDSAPEINSTIEIADIQFTDKNILKVSSPQNAASSLIAGEAEPETITKVKTEDKIIEEEETGLKNSNEEIEKTKISEPESVTESQTSKTTEESDKIKVEITTVTPIESTTKIEDEEKSTEANEKIVEPVVLEDKIEVTTATVQTPATGVKVSEEIVKVESTNEEKTKVEADEKIVESVTLENKIEVTTNVPEKTVEDTKVKVPEEVVITTSVEVKPTDESINQSEKPAVIKIDNVELVKPELEKNNEETKTTVSDVSLEIKNQNETKIEETTDKLTQDTKTQTQSSDNIPDVTTSIPANEDKTEVNSENNDKSQSVKDSSDSTSKPEVIESETTSSSKIEPEKKIDDVKESSSVAEKDQAAPLVRIDVSPEKIQPEITTTKTEISTVAEISSPKTEGTTLKNVEENSRTELPQEVGTTVSSLESSTKTELPQEVGTTVSSLESSTKTPDEPEKIKIVEVVVKPTEETVKEKIDAKVPEVTSTLSPSPENIEITETKPVSMKIENTEENNVTPKTDEIRIQVNETAVLVTKKKVPEEAVSEPTEVPIVNKPAASVEESKETDKKPAKQNEDKLKIDSTVENKKPADPYVKLGENKTEDSSKSEILAVNKKPEVEEKWTLIPQKVEESPSPIIKIKPTSTAEAEEESNQSNKVSVPLLEAHQSAVNLAESTRSQDEDISLFAELCNELAFSFWIAANKGLSTARSLALSPFGMTSMLAMVFLGARGPTSGQMNDILKLDDVVTFNPHLIFQNVTDSVNLARGQGIANAAFVRELFADRTKAGRLLPFYKERAQQFYDGHIEEVNFAAISDLVRRRTNLLVRRQTGGRIRDFVKGNVMPLRSPLAALSANVFQTDCNGASSEGRDGEMYFAVLPAVRQRKLVPVPATVWRSGVLAGYEPGLDATVISLGGVSNLVSTIFVLPGQQGLAAPGDSLDHLERRLLEGAFTNGVWERLLRVLIPRMGLEIQVPKFSHRSVVNATAALKRMGLDDLFSHHADLKGINGVGNDLHLADMLQINLFSTCGDEAITGGRHHVEIYPASPLRGARVDKKISEAEEKEEEEEEKEEEGEIEFEKKDEKIKRSLKVGEYLEFVHDLSKRSTDLESPEKQLIKDNDDKNNSNNNNNNEEEQRSERSSSLLKQSLKSGHAAVKQTDRPLLKLDRPFLYFVRHNPTGMILHMGRFNPRLMP